MTLKKQCLLYFGIIACVVLQAQPITDPYLILNASASDPLYTTYAAAMERSKLYGDKAYKMDYYSANLPLHYSSDQAGRIYHVWRFNAVVVDKIADYHKKPLVIASFPDMVLLQYEPWPQIEVKQTFLVYSSDIALVDVTITNHSEGDYKIDFYPVLELGNDSLNILEFDPITNSYIAEHHESRKRLISNLNPRYPYPEKLRNIFSGGFIPWSHGAYRGTLDDIYNYVKRDFYAKKNNSDSLNCLRSGLVDLLMLHAKIGLKSGETKSIRYFRGVQESKEDAIALYRKIFELKAIDLQPFIESNIQLFSKIPRIDFSTNAEKITYLSAFNLARGCMLPAEGEATFNYYVFSRNPLWGWGHGHQVLHESLSMLAYVYLDAESARGSQRVYMQQQRCDGFIAYRHGPRGVQDYPHKGMPTTSAPFFSWINLEMHKAAPDMEFLKEAYDAGIKYVDWLMKNRDTDKDGLFEWGPYGLIENVRDWYNAVFQVSPERYLEIDKEDISDELECLDLSLMMVKEMKSLSEIAKILGKERESRTWLKRAIHISTLINKTMWDEETGFYYHVDKVNHSFRFMTRDLKRQEIIGFLALWAGVATSDRADKLVRTLTNPDKFWRKYGVPTLSADDPWYSPYVDYCCKWNGPVWFLWNYMVFCGLTDYGYHDIARELAHKMIDAATIQLSKNHNFWESYSPDNDVLNCPPNYIWDVILARLLIDVYARQ